MGAAERCVQISMAKQRKTMAGKNKSASRDFWAFLEEIDAPQWVDLALERTSKCEEWDDSWFHIVHPFHQKSFQELVSDSPLAVQVKGNVSKPVRVCPGLANSVSKSRGGKPWPRDKVAALQLNLPGVNGQHNCKKRLSGGKPTSFKSEGNVDTVSHACSRKPSDVAAAKACSQTPIKENELENSRGKQFNSSTVCDLNNQSSKACVQTHSKGNELEDPMGEQVNSSAAVEVNNLSVVCEIRPAMPRASGLISMLKLASLRRSCGHLPMRVEVKDEQQKKDTKSSCTDSSLSTNRKTSSIGSTSNNSQKVMKEDKVKLLKSQAPDSAVSPIKYNRKKSSTGSTSAAEEKGKGRDTTMAKDKVGKTLKEAGRKQGQPIGRRKNDVATSLHVKTASRQPLQDVNNVGQVHRKSVMPQSQRFAGKENNHLRTAQDQKVNIVERKKPLTSVKETLCDRVELKVNGQSKAQNMLHSIKDIKKVELKANGQSKAQNMLHSIKDIKKWEKNSGRSYFNLSALQREKANREIQISKSQYR